VWCEKSAGFVLYRLSTSGTNVVNLFRCVALATKGNLPDIGHGAKTAEKRRESEGNRAIASFKSVNTVMAKAPCVELVIVFLLSTVMTVMTENKLEPCVTLGDLCKWTAGGDQPWVVRGGCGCGDAKGA
jgi:hypothetical protein